MTIPTDPSTYDIATQAAAWAALEAFAQGDISRGQKALAVFNHLIQTGPPLPRGKLINLFSILTLLFVRF